MKGAPMMWRISIAVMIGAAAAPATACDLAVSNKLVSMAMANGWVIGRHQRGIIADEKLWRQLSMGTKLKLAQAVACQQTGGASIGSEYVSVRGSDGVTIIASGTPGMGQFSDK
jgi:hypothetical protein